MAATSPTSTQFCVNCPSEIVDWLKVAAKAEKRSVSNFVSLILAEEMLRRGDA